VSWRGPFRVTPEGKGRSRWQIVNGHGEPERLGYRDKTEADTVCQLMNAYLCPNCWRVSHNPHDAANRYCGACHTFEEL
jgi:hypothetical protein